MTADDFVDVKLTAAGEAMAMGCLRVHGGNYEYCFLPAGAPQRLSAAEFNSRLAAMEHEGKPVFETNAGVVGHLEVTVDDAGKVTSAVATKKGRS